jgi:hypothetical protein
MYVYLLESVNVPTIKTYVQHKLTEIEAIIRIKLFLEKNKANYLSQVDNFQVIWQAHEAKFAFDFKSMKITGTIRCSGNQTSLECKIPLPLVIFKQTILSKAHQQMITVLEK